MAVDIAIEKHVAENPKIKKIFTSHQAEVEKEVNCKDDREASPVSSSLYIDDIASFLE